MAEENGTNYYIKKEQSSDRKLLKQTPTASEIVTLTLIALFSISFALITVFAWTGNLLSTERALIFILLTAAAGIACIGQVSYETRQLREDLEEQIRRKYEYWMPDQAHLPENHPKASK